MATVCRLEGDEACTTETKVANFTRSSRINVQLNALLMPSGKKSKVPVFQVVGGKLPYEKGECKHIIVSTQELLLSPIIFFEILNMSGYYNLLF